MPSRFPDRGLRPLKAAANEPAQNLVPRGVFPNELGRIFGIERIGVHVPGGALKDLRPSQARLGHRLCQIGDDSGRALSRWYLDLAIALTDSDYDEV